MSSDPSGSHPYDPTVDPLPEALSNAAGEVVALAAGGTDAPSEWARESAVALARGCAERNDRLFLMDLDLEEPALHRVLGLENTEGASDIFLFGSSIQRVARPVDDGAFYFASAGTATTEPESVLRSERWDRLLDGFRDAGAVLLLYLPLDAAGAPDLLARADRIVVLGAARGIGDGGVVSRRVAVRLTPPQGAEVSVDTEPAPDETHLDVGELAPDHPVVDIVELAPDQPVVDIAELAPDESLPEIPEPAAGEEVEALVELEAPASESSAESEEPEEAGLEVGEPTPSEWAEPVMDIGDLSPEEPASEPAGSTWEMDEADTALEPTARGDSRFEVDEETVPEEASFEEEPVLEEGAQSGVEEAAVEDETSLEEETQASEEGAFGEEVPVGGGEFFFDAELAEEQEDPGEEKDFAEFDMGALDDLAAEAEEEPAGEVSGEEAGSSFPEGSAFEGGAIPEERSSEEPPESGEWSEEPPGPFPDTTAEELSADEWAGEPADEESLTREAGGQDGFDFGDFGGELELADEEEAETEAGDATLGASGSVGGLGDETGIADGPGPGFEGHDLADDLVTGPDFGGGPEEEDVWMLEEREGDEEDASSAPLSEVGAADEERGVGRASRTAGSPRSSQAGHEADGEPNRASAARVKDRTAGRPVRLLALLLIVVVGAFAAHWFGFVQIPGLDRALTSVLGPARTGAAPTVETPDPAPSTPVLGYSLLVQSYRDEGAAEDVASALRARLPDRLFVVSPVQEGSQVSHRLLAGPARNVEEALALKQPLSRVLSRENPDEWEVTETSLAFLLRETPRLAEARQQVDGLRSRGVPAYVLQVTYPPDRIQYRVYAGAFASPDEARALQGILQEHGIDDATLTRRRGTLPE